MREFFRGWRRKVGLTTLAVACLFSVGWVRSLTRADEVEIRIDALTVVSIHSCADGIEWTRFYDPEPMGLVVRGFTDSISFKTWQQNPLEFRQSNRLWHRQQYTKEPGFNWYLNQWGFWLGEGYGEHHSEKLIRCNVPYFAVVIPLTAVSAYLLLSKPRQSTQKKTPEPIPEKLD